MHTLHTMPVRMQGLKAPSKPSMYELITVDLARQLAGGGLLAAPQPDSPTTR